MKLCSKVFGFYSCCLRGYRSTPLPGCSSNIVCSTTLPTKPVPAYLPASLSIQQRVHCVCAFWTHEGIFGPGVGPAGFFSAHVRHVLMSTVRARDALRWITDFNLPDGQAVAGMIDFTDPEALKSCMQHRPFYIQKDLDLSACSQSTFEPILCMQKAQACKWKYPDFNHDILKLEPHVSTSKLKLIHTVGWHKTDMVFGDRNPEI